MPIIFNDKTKEFHLYNGEISYIFTVMKNNQLGNLYFGKKVKHRDSFEHLFQTEPRALTACVFEGDHFSLDHIKQEYPSYGSTDFRQPAYQIYQDNGSKITNFEYKSHEIFKGKKQLKGLPATYTESDDEATTLEVTLYDSVINAELVLSYTVFEHYAAIARSARFINHGEEKIVLTNAMSASIDFPDDQYEMLQLSGAWARERHIKTRALQPGLQSVYSARGASSANHNPFIALKRPEATENQGEVLGFSLVYSGNFLAQAEVDAHNLTRVTLGINPFGFQWVLYSKEEFQTPEAVIVYSDKGLNYMSQTYHKLYRTRLARGQWRDKVRPILINNWEATYFDFNEEKILDIAETAKELGIELFVLDDGWFGKRDDDKSSLGDWFPDKSKLPNGITGLAKKIDALELKFGLWFEPEMVNKISELYKNHPDWIISTPNRRVSHGRNQYVLDYSHPEVVDYIYELMAKILREAPISYIKWDMNRYITEAFSAKLTAERQGEFFHRYILGVYSLYERLILEFPYILFESCSSGGARFDPGMLYYAPQTWTSDDTDAVERLKIQYGTSMVYPISSIGSHVSAVPNHQVKRITPIETRANVAYFGTFGFELDLNKLTEIDRLKVKNQVEFFKKHRELIQKGIFYRLVSPFEKDGNTTSWIVVSEDRKEAIAGYYNVLKRPNPGFDRIKLTGLDSEKQYRINSEDGLYYGDELMNIGVLLNDNFTGCIVDIFNMESGDFYSRIFVLKEVE
ncbi:alpha-galactosidase [Clostridium sp. DJ247]|uniref:alpha-galactosidase n=1 Tax=Clostridium sp. DJ247 TaxID=2726188 RepID=UPI00162A8DF5|nr:alpha-galactosidase [Clostridium sp. DJ247]MBC2580448.1 alpha-galactosidase [Clostridium sp. DJ247]